MTGIEWTDETWNPSIGCRRVSEGCRNCYAETMAKRLVHMRRDEYRDVVRINTCHTCEGSGEVPRLANGVQRYAKRSQWEQVPTVPMMTDCGSCSGTGEIVDPRWNGRAVFLRERLDQPLRWQKPRRVFVNSMSDLFHEDLTFEQIAAVFGVMAAAPRHTFQVLTKRPARMLEFFEWLSPVGTGIDPVTRCLRLALLKTSDFQKTLPLGAHPGWPLPNVWTGVSAEDQATADERIPLLLQCPAAVRFVSAEPLLGPIDLRYATFNGADSLASMEGLDWVIVGGESGPGARPCDVAWIRSIVEQCRDACVVCFVKQLGADVRDRNDVGFLGEDGDAWDIDDVTRVEHNPNGFREEYQGAPVRIRLSDRKGGNSEEWPEDLRVREFPEVSR